MTVRSALAVLMTVATALVATHAPAQAQALDDVVRLERIADLDAPTAMATRAGDDALYVAEQAGRVVAVDPSGKVTTMLDLTNRVTSGGEQGLLGLVFSPDGTKLFVNYTNRTGDTRVQEFAVVDDEVEPSSRRTVLAVRQPQPNHNGGQLTFGPDGMLYIGLGDGGGSDDEGDGHDEGGNGQSLDALLGKILRIDPTPAGDRPYTIPSDNPFADEGGRPEIWAYGLRNPWRFSFDRATGDLWIADVGQNDWEEIDLAPEAQGAGEGANFGWNVFEADQRNRDGDTTGPALPPLLALSQDAGYCGVIGGYVYRGARIPALQGAYLYADYCNGKLRYVRARDNEVVRRGTLGVERDSISSFGEDDEGELYVLSQAGGLYRIEPA